jgi:hypothetical protein
MTVHIFLIDFFSFPLARNKLVKWCTYQCGMSPIISLVNSYSRVLDLSVSICITGGPLQQPIALDCPSTVYDRLPNLFQDFSGYSFIVKHFLRNIKINPSDVSLFVNSSCPPAYFKRCLDLLLDYQSTTPLLKPYCFYSPSVSYLFRSRFFWNFHPHLQSYCFMSTLSSISLFDDFIKSLAPAFFNKKKDYIYNLEIGFSDFLLSGNYNIYLVDSHLNVHSIRNYIYILYLNIFYMFDSRLNPFAKL